MCWWSYRTYKTIDKIMHNYEEPQLQSHNSLDELVNKFADNLVTKISVIRKPVLNNLNSNTWTDEKKITRIIGRFLSGYCWQLLTTSALQTVIHAYIGSRLDQCSGFSHGLPTNLVTNLHRILNTATRMGEKREYERITPVMINLHWLPIQCRIQFELLLFLYKPLHGLVPSYLTDKLSLRPKKGLRWSANQLLLNIQFPPLDVDIL